MKDWQPIETAPKDGSEMLGFYADKPASWCEDQFPNGIPNFAAIFWNEEDGWITKPGFFHFPATHWMPLPLTPVGQEKTEEVA